jgi:hypothetical protein
VRIATVLLAVRGVAGAANVGGSEMRICASDGRCVNVRGAVSFVGEVECVYSDCMMHLRCRQLRRQTYTGVDAATT